MEKYYLLAELNRFTDSPGLKQVCEKCGAITFSKDATQLCPCCKNHGRLLSVGRYALNDFLMAARLKGLYYVLSVEETPAGKFRIVSCTYSRWAEFGDIGGLIDGFHNVAQDGSWVDYSSHVFDSAVISGESAILEHSEISENAMVVNVFCCSSVKINGASYVENCSVSNTVYISDYAKIVGSGSRSQIFNHTKVSGVSDINGIFCISRLNYYPESSRQAGLTLINKRLK